MGQVFKNVLVGYPGEVSHSGDRLVKAYANMDNRDIPFGFPVFMNADGTGVVGISASSDPAKFVGFAARVGSKTPPVYDDPNMTGENNVAVYKKGDMMDVLVKGSIVVDATGSNPKPGMPVYLNKEYGKAAAVSSESTLTVPDIYFGTVRDTGGRTEIIVSKRHCG